MKVCLYAVPASLNLSLPNGQKFTGRFCILLLLCYKALTVTTQHLWAICNAACVPHADSLRQYALQCVADVACVAAAGLENQCFSALYASPELLPYVGLACPLMADRPNDVWALGVMLHRVFTCASPNWQTAFEPTIHDEAARQLLPPNQRDVHTACAIARQQALWVGFFLVSAAAAAVDTCFSCITAVGMLVPFVLCMQPKCDMLSTLD